MSNLIHTLHAYNFYLIAPAGAITGIWGLILYFVKKELTEFPKPWRIMLLITVVVCLLQGLLGLIMVLMGLVPAGGRDLYYLHYVYGGITALIIPLAYLSYTTGGKNLRRDLLIYSLVALILVAAGVRAWLTGPA